MSLRDFFRRRPKPAWRYLRAVVEELRGIRLALERGNAIVAATHPGVEQALDDQAAEAAGESGISYIDATMITRVEQEQARIYRATGVLMDVDQVFERLVQEGRLES